MKKQKNQKPVVFACSGCSDAGKASWDLAQYYTKTGVGEMSCLAGLSAEIPVFLKKIINRKIWIIDGCPIHCAKTVMTKMGLQEDYHIKLRDYSVKKYDDQEVNIEELSVATLKHAPKNE